MEQEQGANIPPIRIAKDKFSDYTVLVTGAASGIGKTTALLFSKQGAIVVMLDLNEEGLKAVDDEIKAAGGSSSFRACDLTDEAKVNKAIEWVISVHSRIDVLAHIAGIYPSILCWITLRRCTARRWPSTSILRSSSSGLFYRT